jgi:hypothetical protein
MELIFKYFLSENLFVSKIWGKMVIETIFFERIRFKTLEKDLDKQYAMNA